MPDEPPIYDPFVQARGGPAPPLRPSASPLAEPPRASGMATWALVFGVLGFTCMPAVGGLLALTLGVAARGDISRSGGQRTGSGLAIAGALLGAANLLLSLAGFGALMLWSGSPSTATSPAPTPPPFVAPPTAPTFVPPPSPTAPKSGPAGVGQASREPGARLTRVGRIDLVDIDSETSSLGAELDRQRAAATKDGKTLLLWVVVKDCQPCNGVAASLPDARMQTALERVRLVRVDGRELAAELRFLDVPVAKVPGFVLLSDSNRPVDYVNGGEWDEDIPRNIAPVLGNFVRRRYAPRREQWRGVRRDDETTL